MESPSSPDLVRDDGSIFLRISGDGEENSCGVTDSGQLDCSQSKSAVLEVLPTYQYRLQAAGKVCPANTAIAAETECMFAFDRLRILPGATEDGTP